MCWVVMTLVALPGCADSGASKPDAGNTTSSASPSHSQAVSVSSEAPSSSGSASLSASAKSDDFEDIPDKAPEEALDQAVGDSKLAKQLEKDIKPIVKNSGMDVGVYVIDPESDTQMSLNGDERMASASMIKLAIAACLLEEVEADELSLDDAYTLKDSDIVGGTGSLGGRGAGAKTTYGELLELMISESDNTATNIIIDKLGMSAVNDTAKRLGLESTKLNRLMMDEDAIAKGVENYTSAKDVAAILELAYQGELASKKASATLLKALREQQDSSGILAGLPGEATFAHKTGSLPTVQHDGGIVECDHDFIVVVMCGGNGFSLDGALDAMREIGKVAYEDIV